MLQRIALLLSIEPQENAVTGSIAVTDVETQQPLPVPQRAFVLTLEREPGVTHARGHLRWIEGNVSYPIQSSAALFEALQQYLDDSSGAPAPTTPGDA